MSTLELSLTMKYNGEEYEFSQNVLEKLCQLCQYKAAGVHESDFLVEILDRTISILQNPTETNVLEKQEYPLPIEFKIIEPAQRTIAAKKDRNVKIYIDFPYFKELNKHAEAYMFSYSYKENEFCDRRLLGIIFNEDNVINNISRQLNYLFPVDTVVAQTDPDSGIIRFIIEAPDVELYIIHGRTKISYERP